MAKQTGPKLSAEQRTVIMEMMCAGKGNEEVLTALSSRGWPLVSLNTLAKYRGEERVRAAVEERLQQAQLSGLASRLRRIQQLEVWGEQYVLQSRGFVPNPLNPCDSIPGPPVPPYPSEFRTIVDGALNVFKELDRLVYPERSTEKSTTTIRNADGRIVGTSETNTERDVPMALSPVAYKAAHNDMMERMIAAHDAQSMTEQAQQEQSGDDAQP